MNEKILPITETLEKQIDRLIELRKNVLDSRAKYGLGNNNEEIGVQYSPFSVPLRSIGTKSFKPTNKNHPNKLKTQKFERVEDFFIDRTDHADNNTQDDDFFGDKLLSEKMQRKPLPETKGTNKHNIVKKEPLGKINTSIAPKTFDEKRRARFKSARELLEEEEDGSKGKHHGDEQSKISTGKISDSPLKENSYSTPYITPSEMNQKTNKDSQLDYYLLDKNQDIKNTFKAATTTTSNPFALRENMITTHGFNTSTRAMIESSEQFNSHIDSSTADGTSRDDNTREIISRILKQHENKKLNNLPPTSKDVVQKIILAEDRKKNKRV